MTLVRQLAELTLVAVVLTLRALELLYLVNADVDVPALLEVLIELRQFVDATELADDIGGRRALVGERPRGEPAVAVVDAAAHGSGAGTPGIGCGGSGWCRLCSERECGLFAELSACPGERLFCLRPFAPPPYGPAVPGAPRGDGSRTPRRPRLQVEAASESLRGREKEEDEDEAVLVCAMAMGADAGGAGALRPISRLATLLAVEAMARCERSSEVGGDASSTGEIGPDALDAALRADALFLPKLSFQIEVFFWTRAGTGAVIGVACRVGGG